MSKKITTVKEELSVFNKAIAAEEEYYNQYGAMPMPTDQEWTHKWSKLSRTQKMYTMYRQASKTQKEAAQMAGTSINTIKQWPKWVLAMPDELTDYRVQNVMTLMQGVALQALQVKVDALNSPDEKTRQQAADFILNHTIGRPGQKLPAAQNTVEGDQTIIFVPDNRRETFAGAVSQSDVNEMVNDIKQKDAERKATEEANVVEGEFEE